MTSDTPAPSDTGSNLPSPRGFNTKAASVFLGISTSWLRKARIGATSTPGPAFKKVGRRVIYTLSSLNKFLDD